MNDSRTLDYWKNGDYPQAITRTALYFIGFMFGLFMSTVLAFVVTFIVMLPSLVFLMDELCRAVWNK